MAQKDWDNQEFWEDVSRCLVCKADMGRSSELICSATCEDIQQRQAIISSPWYDVENDCYA